MTLPAIVGHQEIRAALARSVAGDSLPQSILLHGPTGAGKERLALWLGQLLLCEAPAAEPCGVCDSCRLALRLEHPDLHWFFPLPRPDASSPEKLREKLEESRASELQAWRAEPFRIPAHDRPPAHFLAAVRSLQRLASVRPVVGKRAVFVIGDAELMVPQEASPEAANAFLKLLEEPPPSTTLLLTSSYPGALLPTIRSRLLAIRVGPLAIEEIASLLVDNEIAKGAEAEAIARRSGGSVRRAVGLAAAIVGGAGDPQRQAGRELLLAALTTGAAARLAAANDRRPAGARNELLGELDAFAEWLRDLAAVAVGAPERLSDPDALPMLQRAVDRRRVTPEGVADALDDVWRARELAQRNVNPQLIVANLLREVQADLMGSDAMTEERSE
jgi:DNA polymerase III subunit delta'